MVEGIRLEACKSKGILLEAMKKIRRRMKRSYS